MIALERLRELLPERADYAPLRTSWMRDVLAGMTVGVVALPLALAFGVATGLGAHAGLITAIVAGLVAGVFGGSHVQVSGPTGAMTAVLIPVVARYGAEAVPIVAILAGILMAGMAAGRLGRYLAYVPWPVIEGFTVGIAAIIFLQQVPAALGVVLPPGENVGVVAVRAVGLVSAHAWPSLLLVIVSAGSLMALTRLHRALPASLLAVAGTTIVAELMHAEAPRIGALPAGFLAPALPVVPWSDLGALVPAAIAVALLAALESLLSARVADGMSVAPRHHPDRELFGQALANIASPLFGGMPATGAIARTAVNVRAGARTRVAALTHAVVLAAVLLAAGTLVARIPLAALAGVLMVTAVRMVDPRNVRAVVRATRSDALVLVATAAATIAFDLIVAVQIGLAIASILALRAVARAASVSAERISAGEDASAAALLHEGIISYRLDGALFFGAAQRFLNELTTVSDAKVAILRLPNLQMLDATGASALGEIVGELEDRGITVLLKGPRPEHLRTLRAVGAIDRLAHEKHLLADFESAVAHARLHVRRAASGEGSK